MPNVNQDYAYLALVTMARAIHMALVAYREKEPWLCSTMIGVC